MISAYEYDYQALLPSTAPIGRVMSAAGRAGKIMDMMVGWAGLLHGGAALGEGSGKTVATLETAPPRPGHGQRLVAGTPAGPGHYIIAMI